MEHIKNLSLVTELKIEGTDKVVAVDFSDKRFINKLLKLVKKYQTIEEVIDAKTAEIDKIEDELDKLIAYTDMEEEVLTEFKNDVDNVFNTNLTEQLFGNTIPDISRYFDLFATIMPYVQAAKLKEAEMMKNAVDKYGAGRLKLVDNK